MHRGETVEKAHERVIECGVEVNQQISPSRVAEDSATSDDSSIIGTRNSLWK